MVIGVCNGKNRRIVWVGFLCNDNFVLVRQIIELSHNPVRTIVPVHNDEDVIIVNSLFPLLPLLGNLVHAVKVAESK